MEHDYRMYCLAERHLSSIQKAIQSAHAIVEYGLAWGPTPEYQHWAKNNKTIVILDGGTCPEMTLSGMSLFEINHPYAIFQEPDMNFMKTAICFLADERVWDYSKYGHSYEEYNFMTTCNSELPKWTYEEWVDWIGGQENANLKALIANKRLAI